jgi:acetyl-CoA C-acetyltransferase
MTQTVIVSSVRTPIGVFLGSLSVFSATSLGSAVIREALLRSGIDSDQVDEVFMGNVLSAGVGQAPARQAALGAGLPNRVAATTINKVCGSGLKSVMLADQAVRLDEAKVVVAGGMESMSQAPYLLERARTGYRMGHGALVDSLVKDGLWDVYNQVHMGSCAERLAERYRLSREMQDHFAAESYSRALEAQKLGLFAKEIVPVDLPKKETSVSEDEGPKRFDPAKMRHLQPAFEPNGTVTAANSSQISDGAAALVLTSEEEARRRKIRPVARVVGYAQSAGEPAWFTTAPIEAMRELGRRIGWDFREVDLFEINEAFSGMVLVVEKELGLDHRKVNVHGGAVALGHPIGASGARILVTLLHALKERGGRRGVASLCIGGGEAIALAVELV